LSSPSSLGPLSPAATARLLGALSTALLIGFATACVFGLLPPRLLDPQWQWRFSGILIDNAPVAVVGFGLLHLAAYIDPANDNLQRRIAGLSRWATAAVLGFLLLIPLQGLAVARGLSTASLQHSRQLRQFNSTLAQLRQDIQSAPDAASLQRRLPASLASAIGPVALQQPLPQLRAQVLALVDQVQHRGSARLGGGVTISSHGPVILRSLRVLLSAPAYAAAFAAMVFQPGAELSLLDRFLRSWNRLSLRPWRLGPKPKNAIDSSLHWLGAGNEQESGPDDS